MTSRFQIQCYIKKKPGFRFTELQDKLEQSLESLQLRGENFIYRENAKRYPFDTDLHSVSYHVVGDMQDYRSIYGSLDSISEELGTFEVIYVF